MQNCNKFSDNRYFATTDFYLACYLLAKEVQLVSIERRTAKQFSFIFINNVDVIELLDSFDYVPKDSTKVMVDPRTFITAIKSLKSRLYRRLGGSND